MDHDVSTDRAWDLEVVTDKVSRLTNHEAVPLDDFLVAHPEYYDRLKARWPDTNTPA